MSLLSLPALNPGVLHQRLYPRDLFGMIRQCAWCLRVADTGGDYRLWSARLIPSATHGCCTGCADDLLRDTVGLANARSLAGAA